MTTSVPVGRLSIVLAGAAAAALVAAPLASPQLGAANAVTPARVAKWVSVVWAHEPGRADAAADEALSFTARELFGILSDVQASRLPVGRADVPHVLARGAVLHTDVAATEMRRAQRADEASGGGAAAAHLAHAEGLVRQLGSRQASHPLIHAWYLAAGALLSSQLEVAATPALLDRALAVFPDDSQLLLLAGAAHELRASPRVQDALDLSAATRREVGDASKNLRAAESHYRLALLVAPTQVEPRIRLGRVFGLTGRYDLALAELETAARNLSALAASGADVERQLNYYLALFLGEALENTGRVDEARRSLQQALELYPEARSAWFELSRLEWRNGARRAAAAAVARASGPARAADAEDPWQQYFCAGPARDADRWLAALRGTIGERR